MTVFAERGSARSSLPLNLRSLRNLLLVFGRPCKIFDASGPALVLKYFQRIQHSLDARDLVGAE